MVSENNRSSRAVDGRQNTATKGRNSDESERDRWGNESRMERRSVLKLLGVGAIPFAAGTASAAESSDGYGTGEYGTGAYGGENDSTSGTDGSTEDTSLENTIIFDGVGTSGGSRYEFSVTGTVEKSTDKGASINDDDTIDGGQVTGSVGGWRDAFRFSGELEALTVDGQANVYVNGDRINPANYGDEQSQVLTIVGNGVYSEYEFTTNGSIEKIEGDGGTVVSDGRAEGAIERDVHRFRLTGELGDFTFHEGETQVYLDKQRIDPADYTGDNALPSNAIVIDGTDATNRSTYSFTIDGTVSKAVYRGATIDESDEIDNETVRGVTDAGTVDAYWFDGMIGDFSLAGDADVDVEYDARS